MENRKEYFKKRYLSMSEEEKEKLNKSKLEYYHNMSE